MVQHIFDVLHRSEPTLYIYSKYKRASIFNILCGKKEKCQEKTQYLHECSEAGEWGACLRGERRFPRPFLCASFIHILISTFMWNLIVNYFRSLEQTSTCLFQSYFRGYCARQFVKCIHASIIIQTAYRRYFARRRYLVLRKATVYIQSVQRMKREQTRYEELRNTTMKLQRRVKANQLGRKVKAEYLETCYNIIQLQALWRGSKAREIVRRMKSARVIQRWYRACVEGRRVRAQFVLVRKAVITMQACYRGNIARQQFKRERAARTIQAHVRGYQARALFKVYDLSYNLNI